MLNTGKLSDIDKLRYLECRGHEHKTIVEVQGYPTVFAKANKKK
jgi:hypothetical protein